jgi:hypothetical protein
VNRPTANAAHDSHRFVALMLALSCVAPRRRSVRSMNNAYDVVVNAPISR